MASTGRRWGTAAIAAMVGCVVLAPEAHGATQVFNVTGFEQSFKVPKGVKKIQVLAIGAPGGRGGGSGPPGGQGGSAQATIAVKPGSFLYIDVGGPGGNAIAMFNGNPN